jgi:choline dehydrogenase-like flavoprotein
MPSFPSAIVVGSGPAAAGAVDSLVDLGLAVSVLDVGLRLDAGTREVVQRMSQTSPEKWLPADLDRITARDKPETETVHSKRCYGSGYAFDDCDNALRIDWDGPKSFNHSLSYGGLTNVWGASMLPYRPEDLTDWPVPHAELIPHYRAIMRMVPCTNGREDDLEAILPSYSEQTNRIRLSRQGQSLLGDLEKNRSALLCGGLRFGRARLAIKATDASGRDACQYCGLCLSGCPYSLIYSASHSFNRWIADRRITYHADHLVERVEQSADGAVVHGIRLGDGSPFRMEAAKLFIACGVLPTARIVLNSRPDISGPLNLRDSQSFLYPVLRFKSAGDVATERMHTATQLFMELEDPSVSRHLVHIQWYGYSTLLRDEIMRTFLGLPLRWKWLNKQFFGRLMIAQGFIHSTECGHVELSRKPEPGGPERILARPVRSWRGIKAVLMIGLKLLRHWRNLGALCLLPGVKIPRPGASYHSGCTFPMRKQPGPGETDTLGRLPGWSSIHIVDSSVFPSIAATSIVMTAMANARRIASEAFRDQT